MLILLFVALWFILRDDLFVVFVLFCFAWCYFVLVFFSPLSNATTSLGKEKVNQYVRSICACLVLSVSASLGVWEGLRLVIVALPWLFSYSFFFLFALLYCLALHQVIRVRNCPHQTPTTSPVVLFLTVPNRFSCRSSFLCVCGFISTYNENSDQAGRILRL